jgi:hypothetical protein
MKLRKSYIVAGMIIAFALFFELAAHASVAGRSTEIIVNQPIQASRQGLPAGTYIFKLANTDNLNIVTDSDAGGSN